MIIRNIVFVRKNFGVVCMYLYYYVQVKTRAWGLVLELGCCLIAVLFRIIFCCKCCFLSTGFTLSFFLSELTNSKRTDS